MKMAELPRSYEEGVYFKSKPAGAIVCAIFSALFVAVSVRAWPSGWSIVNGLIFGALLLASLMSLRRDRYYLRLHQSGLEYAGLFGPRFIEWRHILGFDVINDGETRYVQWRYSEDHPPSKGNPASGRLPTEFGMKPEDLQFVLNDAWRNGLKARASSGNPGPALS